MHDDPGQGPRRQPPGCLAIRWGRSRRHSASGADRRGPITQHVGLPVPPGDRRRGTARSPDRGTGSGQSLRRARGARPAIASAAGAGLSDQRPRQLPAIPAWIDGHAGGARTRPRSRTFDTGDRRRAVVVRPGLRAFARRSWSRNGGLALSAAAPTPTAAGSVLGEVATAPPAASRRRRRRRRRPPADPEPVREPFVDRQPDATSAPSPSPSPARPDARADAEGDPASRRRGPARAGSRW